MYDRDKRTTDLEKLKKGSPFTWGKVIAIHSISTYDVVEYHSWERKDSRIIDGQADLKDFSFHIYVNGNDCCETFDSLDAALAACIAYKFENSDHRADRYFIAGLKNLK